MMQQDPGLLVSNQGLLVWTCMGSHAHPAAADQHGELPQQQQPAPDSIHWDTSSELELVEQPLAVAVTQEADVHNSSVRASILTVSIEPSPDMLQDGPFTVVLPPPYNDNAAMTLPLPGAWSPASTVAAQLQSTQSSASAHTVASSAGSYPAVAQQPGPQPRPEDAFRLHTRPPGSVQHTIFLDFRGCTITETYWNTATSKQVLTTQPFDLDGDPSVFSVNERVAVVSIWQAVAQDFAPWAVDVTTEDPGEEALVK
jgi:hypothetical protein